MSRFAKSGVGHAVGHALSYALWCSAIRLLALTVVTYFQRQSQSRFEEIGDILTANEITIVGLSSLAYVVLLVALNPLTSSTPDEVFTPHRFERRFAPGFAFGAALGVGVISAFLLSGLTQYLGAALPFEEAPVALLGLAFRTLAVGAMVYCEEYIFRHKILNHLRKSLPDAPAATAAALLYCGVKATQFDIGWSHGLTLFLIALVVSMRTVIDGDFARGAGTWAGLLIVFHPMLGLPIFGRELQGIIILKPADAALADRSTARLLTGGAAGPLSSLSLQLLLLADLALGIFRNHKLLARAPRVRQTGRGNRRLL